MFLGSIDGWVEYIQGLHFREIDLGLDRVRSVYRRLRPNGVNFKVISVAGTNGKGSTCELLASIYHAGGYSVGKYTSPHIERFNERFSVNRSDVSDQDLLTVFERVEEARADVKLTFFEFGTLLAIELFADQHVDVAIMEVGLGGRLDAVNVLDADVAVVTNVSIDHTDWLGSTVAQIALEKIGISRENKPCVVGMRQPPEPMLNYCREQGVSTYSLGESFDFDHGEQARLWQWHSSDIHYRDLPLPFSQSGVQLDNASVALKAVQLLSKSLPLDQDTISLGIESAKVRARCQVVSKAPMVVVDVAHNQASVARLAEFIAELDATGQVYAICGMLSDKKIAESLREIALQIDEWHTVTIHNERGASANKIASILNDLIVTESDQSRDRISGQRLIRAHCHDHAHIAFEQVTTKMQIHDVLIVFGSFFVVGDIMPLLNSDGSVSAK